jgi:hypothetical protein
MVDTSSPLAFRLFELVNPLDGKLSNVVIDVDANAFFGQGQQLELLRDGNSNLAVSAGGAPLDCAVPNLL